MGRGVVVEWAIGGVALASRNTPTPPGVNSNSCQVLEAMWCCRPARFKAGQEELTARYQTT